MKFPSRRVAARIIERGGGGQGYVMGYITSMPGRFLSVMKIVVPGWLIGEPGWLSTLYIIDRDCKI